MRVLFVTPRPPWPGRRGDQVRVSGLVRGLAPNHDVHLLSQCWPGQSAGASPNSVSSFEAVEIGRPELLRSAVAASWCGVTGRGEAPLQALLYDYGRFRAATRRSVERLQPDVVVVVLSRLGGIIDALAPAKDWAGTGVPVVLDLIDALGANMERRAERERWLAPLWRREARRLHAWDRRLLGRVRAATVVAERDRRAILDSTGDRRGAADADLERKLRVLPFGLDVSAAAKDSAPSRNGPDRGGVTDVETIVLTGNLGYFPTVEGASWFADAVWPRILSLRPRSRWVLAGSRPAPAIRRLASRDGVELIANPADLGVHLAAAAVSIAPLRAGSGTPIKILEAMASQVPVVTTPAGRDGLDGLPVDAIGVASSAKGFADEVLRLLGDPDLRAGRAATARTWLEARHALPRVIERFEALLGDVIAGGY